MWIVTFRPLHCWSSSGDGVDWLRNSMSSTRVVLIGAFRSSLRLLLIGRFQSLSFRLEIVPDRSKHLITKPSVISQENKHLSSVLVSNGYPFSFVKNITKTKKQTATKEPAPEIKSTAVLPYFKGLSEALCRCLQQQGIRTVFRSDTTLRSHLVRPKDTVDPAKQEGVVYKIPCECGKVYIGETVRSMHERIKEHDRDIRLART